MAGQGGGNTQAEARAFEEFCRNLVDRWVGDHLKGRVEVEYRTGEPIDILVREFDQTGVARLPGAQLTAGVESGCREHFIECKNYYRNIGLDVVAPAFLHALRQQPSSLTIATQGSLTAGAREMALWLFNEHLRKSIRLYHWMPLGGAGTPAAGQGPQQAETRMSSVHLPPVSLQRWSLHRRRPLHPIFLADGDSQISAAQWLRLDEELAFRAAVDNPVPGRHIRAAYLRLSASDGSTRDITLIVEGVGRGAVVSGTIKASELAPDVDYREARLDLETTGGTDSHVRFGAFPVLRVEPRALVLPDLRADSGLRVYGQWMARTSSTMLLLEGEGGAGKTYLCEQIAALAAGEGWRSAHVSLEARSEVGILAEVVWLLLSPNLRGFLKQSDRMLTGSLLREIAAGQGASVTEQDAAALAGLLIDGLWDGGDPDALARLVASVAASADTPLLLVVSNTHRASDTATAALRALLAALEAAGWGRVRLVVEARNTPEDVGESWSGLRQWISDALGHRVFGHDLPPLSKAELRAGVLAAMGSTSDDALVQLVVEKCGHSPLFLWHLLQGLLERGILVPILDRLGNRGPTYAVAELSSLRAELAALDPRVDELLRRRIDYWHGKLGETGLAGFILGLMSILKTEMPLEVLAVLTGRPAGDLETALLQLASAGLVDRRPDDSFCFSHEFAGVAAAQWLAGRRDANTRLASFADSPAPIDGPWAFVLAMAKGRLHRHLRRHARAFDALNAALQMAGNNFEREYQCRRELHELLAAGGEEAARAYHENVKPYLDVGYYVLACRESIAINEGALARAEAATSVALQRAERRAYLRRYRHNLANLALRALDVPMFLRHAPAALDACRTPLEVSQFLNRAVKFCGMVGETGVGRRFGALARGLQTLVDPAEDRDLEAVLLGEASFLYAHVDPTAALDVAELACRSDASPRQKAHDLFARASANLRLGRHAAAEADLAEVERAVAEMSLKTLQPSLNMLEGTLACARQRWREAADLYRVALADTAWLGQTREELRIGTNLVVARAEAGNLDGAAKLNSVLLEMAARRGWGDTSPALAGFLAQLDAAVGADPNWELAARQGPPLPPIPERGPDLLLPLRRNAARLASLWPDRFAAPAIPAVTFAGEVGSAYPVTPSGLYLVA